MVCFGDHRTLSLEGAQVLRPRETDGAGGFIGMGNKACNGMGWGSRCGFVIVIFSVCLSVCLRREVGMDGWDETHWYELG